jgi:hypothetical protein
VLGGTLGALIVTGLIVASLAALIGGLIASSISQREQTVSTTNSFVVGGTPSLVISDPAGAITVQSGSSGSHVVAQITKRAWGSSNVVAHSLLNTMPVALSQSGATITIRAQFTPTSFDGATAKRAVDLLVTVPAQVNVDLRLSAGNIDLRQIAGVITVDSQAGNLTTEQVTFADGSRLSANAGVITMDGDIASGARVQILVNAGAATISLPASSPAYLDASTGVGGLSVIGWPIAVVSEGMTGRRASGDLSPNPTARITAHVSTGSLTIKRR